MANAAEAQAKKKKKKKKRIKSKVLEDNEDYFDEELPGIDNSTLSKKQLKMRHRNHKKLCLFYPEDTIKQHWDLFITLILLISCIIVPYRIAFGEIDEPIEWKIINYTIDAMFAIDIFIIFNSAYHDSEYRIVEDRKKIAEVYLKSWFFIDVLSIMPFDEFVDTS